jgi:hypothetical protein|tara:strand:+ start:1035 stop:1703 length:669 start_codon:yes stop_codon:yes gene_type:complete
MSIARNSPLIKTTTAKHRKKTKKTKQTKKNPKVYSSKDYSSGDGMLTSVWGPGMWHYLHTMSFNYPIHPTPEEKVQYRKFVLSLEHVLPCKYCRINLKNNFKHFPLTMKCMKNRNTFSRYIYNLHELINKMLNKKSNLTYCDVRERYEHFRSRCTDDEIKTKNKLFKFSKKTLKNRLKKEMGCTEPLYGHKSKCIIKIVPQETKGQTFQMDEKCVKKRTSSN